MRKRLLILRVLHDAVFEIYGLSFRKSDRNFICAGVSKEAGMSGDIIPGDFFPQSFNEAIELFPKVAVEDLRTLRGFPAFPFPIPHP